MTNKLQELMACCDVTRWHTVNVARQQSVAEHQWAVAMLALEINRRLPGVNEYTLLLNALYHDTAETESGDPPPSEPTGELIDRINRMPPGSAIVKMADLMEAAWFIQNNAMGKRAEERSIKIEDRLRDVMVNILDADLAQLCSEVWNDLNGRKRDGIQEMVH